MQILFYVGVVSLPRTPDRGLLSVPIPGQTASETSRCSESHGVCVTVCVLLLCVCVYSLQYHHLSDHLFAAAFDNGLLQVHQFVFPGFPVLSPPPFSAFSFTSYVLRACMFLCGQVDVIIVI